MKKSTSLCKLIGIVSQEEKVPDGFYPAWLIAKESGKTREYVLRRLRDGLKSSAVEQKTFRAKTENGRVQKLPHFRFK